MKNIIFIILMLTMYACTVKGKYTYVDGEKPCVVVRENKIFFSYAYCDVCHPKDTISIVRHVEAQLYFPNGIALEHQVEDRPHGYIIEYYTHKNLSKLIRKNECLNAKITWDLDSLGKIARYEKEYLLKRKFEIECEPIYVH